MLAPPELAQMGLDPSAFHRSDSKSWRGPCPRCGGHRRLLAFTDQPFPKWHVICDGCGLKAWADQLNAQLKQPISAEQRREWEERNAREHLEREAERQRKLAEFVKSGAWHTYHEWMDAANRAWWESQGIPGEWQDYLEMGFVPHKQFMGDNEPFISAAHTIPIFDFGRLAVNMQYRIVDPPKGVGKYRQEPGLPARAFLSDPSLENTPDEVYVVEGAKKAAVLQIWHDGCKLAIGVPGARSWAGIVEKVKDCGRVWVILDPDARQAAYDMAKAIGPTARIVTLPCKPDDMFVAHGGTSHDLHKYMRWATRI